MIFWNCRTLLEECVKAGLIKTVSDGEHAGELLVYRQAGINPEKQPEGWYAEPLDDMAQELMGYEIGQKFLLNKLKEKGITPNFLVEFERPAEVRVCELDYVYKECMRIGNWFAAHDDKNAHEEWLASEHCATFAKIVFEITESTGYKLEDVASGVYRQICEDGFSGFSEVEDHMWDDYCKGFLAGEILGDPNDENIAKAETAEMLWNTDDGERFGYYQEALESVKEDK